MVMIKGTTPMAKVDGSNVEGYTFHLERTKEISIIPLNMLIFNLSDLRDCSNNENGIESDDFSRETLGPLKITSGPGRIQTLE